MYIQTCKRLPTYGCELFEVKEIIRTRTTKKRISRILALGINRISLLDASSYILTKEQKTDELIEWRSGLGSSGDRVLFEFRSLESRTSCKWNLVVCTPNSLSNIGRTLLNLMMNSLQTSSAFLAKLLNVDEKLFIVEDELLTDNVQQTKNQSDNKQTTATNQQSTQDITNQTNITNSKLPPKVLYNNEILTNLNLANCEELELLYTMLHFPEEVAFRLAEVDYELFYNVAPVDYIQHVTLCLNQINPEEQTAAHSKGTNKIKQKPHQQYSSNKTYNVQDLIRRFNKISCWVTHLIIIQPTHDDRKAVLSCLIRVAQCAFNMGSFNTVQQILAGLK